MENESGSAQLDVPAGTNVATLFDTLSTDALSIVVKRMNRRLQEKVYTTAYPYEQPAPHMARALERIRFLALLFSENSPFRAAAATLVRDILLRWPAPGTSIDSSTNRLYIGPEMFEGEAKEVGLGRLVFSACGPFVRRVFVNGLPDGEPRANKFVEDFTSYVFQYCRSVEEFMVGDYHAPMTKWGTGSSFFREYAENLRKIDWNGEEDENGFADLEKCINLRHLRSRYLNTGTLISLLKTCGSTLEHLDVVIKPVGDSIEIVEAIRNYCEQLKVFRIDNLKNVMGIVGQESYSSLIRSLGTQLKNANTEGLDHEHLVEVVNACANLEVDLYRECKRIMDWEHVYDLGPRLAKIRLTVSSLRGDEYPRALEQCSNLRKLGLGSSTNFCTTDEMIANVFAPARYPKLEDLTVTYFKANRRNLSVIASCTANLKSARFELSWSDLEVSAFQLIADSNRHLKDIVLRLHGSGGPKPSGESALESLSELVRMFCKCPKLHLNISCADSRNVKKEDLIRICKVVPCRDVDVFVMIGDVWYSSSKV